MGTVFIALGIAICGKAELGVSMIAAPAFVISEAVSGAVPFFSTGVTSYLIQGTLLLLLCVVIRRFNWRFLLTFASAVVYGYTLDLFLWILGGFSVDTVAARWVLLLVGNSISAFGVACFFRTYLPLQVFELFVAEIAKKFSFSVGKTKLGFDLSMLAVSVILAVTLFGDVADFDWASIYCNAFHNVGLGTIVAAFLNSPVIALSGKLLDKLFDNTPMSQSLYKFLKI